jgi:hypothetical protein
MRIIIGSIILFIVSARSVFAAQLCPAGQFSALCNINIANGGGTTFVTSIVTILLILAILLALFFFIWGGIRWITSGGDKQKIDQARATLTASIVGLIIAFISFFIVNFISYLFTGQAISSFALPTLVK